MCSFSGMVERRKELVMNRKYWLMISAVIMMIVGILRAGGGIALLMNGARLETEVPIIATSLQINIVASGLLFVGVLFFLAAIGLIRGYSRRSWNTCWIVLLLFLAGGLINGYMLFGRPLDQGQIINLVSVVLVGIFLILGKPALQPAKSTP